MPTPDIVPQLVNPRDIIDQAGLNILLRDLSNSRDNLSTSDRETLDRSLQGLSRHFDHLKDSVRYLTEDRGENLKKMDPENIKLIIDVIADSPEEAARLKELLARGEFDQIAKAIDNAKKNPEKLIEISEIMLMDGSIPDIIKNSIKENLHKINEILKVFYQIGEQYSLVIPFQAFGSEASERREDFAREISGFIERRSLWLKDKVVDKIIELAIPTKAERDKILADIRERLEVNHKEQGGVRQSLFLLREDQVTEYRDLLRKLVNLVGDESHLKEQEMKYRALEFIG